MRANRSLNIVQYVLTAVQVREKFVFYRTSWRKWSKNTTIWEKKRRVKLEAISTSKSPVAYEEAHEKVNQKFNKREGEIKHRVLVNGSKPQFIDV